jgi:hypothetical protein
MMSEPTKRPRGRPRITDESLRKTPLVRSEKLGRPFKYEIPDDMTDKKEICKLRYKDMYIWSHKVHFLKSKYHIPPELLELPHKTIEQSKDRFLQIKKYTDELNIRRLMNDNIYRPKQKKNIIDL